MQNLHLIVIQNTQIIRFTVEHQIGLKKIQII